ncbi:Alpha/Beta hydrolase protein [Crassisporium funariophilum]|nr:Alpha/Beta hydrolase protein [Crassisporium funariophilum]
MYMQLAEIPVPTATQFLITPGKGVGVVQTTYLVRDHVRNIKRTMAKSIVFSTGESIPNISPTPTALLDTDVVAQVVSSSGRRRAVLRAVKVEKSKSCRLVEIWNGNTLEVVLDVTESHGEFYTDEYLASLSFAPSESAILYTAEAKVSESKDPFQRFRFNPDFGEGLVGKRNPKSFILRWDTSSFVGNGKPRTSLFELEPESQVNEGVRFGQAVFSPNSDQVIYATGYEFTMDGRILGIKGCFNRPSGIWQLRLPGTLPPTGDKENIPVVIDAVRSLKLTSSHLSCRSPRVINQDGQSFLIWLASATGGAHLATSTLHRLNITSDPDALDPKSTDSPLVGFSKDLSSCSPDVFPGLYPAYNLPPLSPVVTSPSSGPSILLHSQWGSRTTVLIVSMSDGSVKDLTPDTDATLYSWSVLATDGRSHVVCQRSTASVPYEILIGRFDSSGSVVWNLLDKPDLREDVVGAALSKIRTSIVPIPNRYPVETILIRSSVAGASAQPCITSPHGGPHGATSTAFSPSTTALVLEGYTLSLPNYTGSPGYGEAFIQSLIGRCGELDVEDCIASVRHLIDSDIAEDGPGKNLVMGGSHGGFLTAHMIGQYPNLFSAAILRNPVISVGEISSTDIPDWYFAEFGMQYPMESSPALSVISRRPPLLSVETFEKLHAASPIAYIDSVCVPVLLLIGAADRRVAPTHGVEFYHALKARYTASAGKGRGNRKVEMLVFEGESHPLDGVEAAKAGFDATKVWFADARNAHLT